MTQTERRLYLIKKLQQNDSRFVDYTAERMTSAEQKQLLRAMMNVWMPAPIDEEYRRIEGAYLRQDIAATSGRATSPPCRVTRSSMPRTAKCSAALYPCTTASITASTAPRGCHCATNATRSCAIRVMRKKRVRRRSPLPTTCRVNMFSTRWDRSSAADSPKSTVNC